VVGSFLYLRGRLIYCGWQRLMCKWEDKKRTAQAEKTTPHNIEVMKCTYVGVTD